MQGTWARFAKNPLAGPGWNQLGTGASGLILQGSSDQVLGGIFQDRINTVVKGNWNLGVFGDVGNARGSGVTILPQSDVDFRCGLFKPIYEAIVGPNGFPPGY